MTGLFFSSPGILQRYSKAIDEYRRDAVRKLEEIGQNTCHGGTLPLFPSN
jgi:hypothetical protein